MKSPRKSSKRTAITDRTASLRFLYPGEKEAISEVIRAGRLFGYGNMIDHLQREWDEVIAASVADFARRTRKTKEAPR